MFFGSNENEKICFWNLLTFSLLADLFGQKTVVLRPAAHCISFSNQFHCYKISFGYSTQFIWETFSHVFSVMSIKEIRHRRKWHYIFTYVHIRKDLELHNVKLWNAVRNTLILSKKSFNWCLYLAHQIQNPILILRIINFT